MKKIILNAIKYFIFLFLIIEIVPYILNKRDFKEIGLQTLLIAIISIGISIRDYKKTIFKGGKSHAKDENSRSKRID